MYVYNDFIFYKLTIGTLMNDYDTYIVDKWNGYDLPAYVTEDTYKGMADV
jgi:hypothetical protein